MEQGSPEWKAARLGRLTASCVADATDVLKSGKPGAKQSTYMGKLIAERLTGIVVEKYQNDLMRWGTAQEPEARSLYAFLCGIDVETVGFIDHPSIAMSGASPDGLVGTDGLIEIKCPSTSTHVDTLVSQAIPEEYVKQIDWQLACTGRQWCDFVSYDPRLPPHLSIFIKRRERDEAAIAALEASARKFLDEIAAKIAALNALYPNSSQSRDEGRGAAQSPLASGAPANISEVA